MARASFVPGTIEEVLRRAETPRLAKKRQKECPVYRDVYGRQLSSRLCHSPKPEILKKKEKNHA
ncbi:MAG: hypothetical protein MSH10_02625 [Pygmaiobacter massiliensis]|nr:hypothetical protein [Pygmaiobacter massiliensis]